MDFLILWFQFDWNWSGKQESQKTQEDILQPNAARPPVVENQ